MKPLFFGTLKGLLSFIISATLLLTVFTVIALRLDDPAKTTSVFGNAVLILSAFVSGRFSVNNDGTRLISGICVGIFDTLFLLSASLIFFGLGTGVIFRVFLTVLLSVLGALSKKTVKGDLSVRKRKSNLRRYAAYR